MQPTDIEQRYRKRQLWFFWSQLVAGLAILLVTFLNSDSPNVPADRGDFFGSPALVYLAVAAGLAIVASVLGSWSAKKWSGVDLRDDATKQRLHDEHERAIRFRAESRALHTVLYLQALFYGWLVLQSRYALPVLPVGISQVATLLIAHLVFWIPYLRGTR
jgi:hypothetical protein